MLLILHRSSSCCHAQSAVILQRRVERVVHDNKWLLFAGRQAFRSFVRAYATHSQDTKGIFTVQQLHLGHVAKSFGLRESPKALRGGEDVISKIFNGAYSALNLKNSRDEKRDKFRAGGGGKGQDGKKRKRGGDEDSGRDGKRGKSSGSSSPSSSTQNPGVAVKSGRDKQKVRKMGKASGAGGGAGAKRGGSSSSSKGRGDRLTASGAFRKTTGYFKKKLRSQMSSEFSSN